MKEVLGVSCIIIAQEDLKLVQGIPMVEDLSLQAWVMLLSRKILELRAILHKLGTQIS